MTMIPAVRLHPTLQTLAFFAGEYETTGDDIVAHQAAAALVAVWKAGNLDLPCLPCQAHDAQTPADLVKAAHALRATAFYTHIQGERHHEQHGEQTNPCALTALTLRSGSANSKSARAKAS